MNWIKESDIRNVVIETVTEDLGTKDITSLFFIPAGKRAGAAIIAKEACVICGLSIAASVFKEVDKSVYFKPRAADGDFVKKGAVLARIRGNARSILSAERVALNFLSLLSGIATKTRGFVSLVKPYKVKIIDTRKTTPGLRLFEKYAVRCGGGFNHRLSLDDMVLIKDNHLKIIGGIKKIRELPREYKTEIEVNTLEEFKIALALRPSIIMLDNMSVAEMKKAVKLRDKISLACASPAPCIEASGGITQKNIRKVASTGVDMISIGALTHSIDSADISLEIQ